MRYLIFFAVLITAAMASTSVAQELSWKVKVPHEISTTLSQLPLADRTGITSRLHMKRAELRAKRVSTQPEDIFFVQSFGSDSCGAVGNCRFWVLDSNYNILLKGGAQWASLLLTSHGGRRDVITSLHNSAFDSELTQWRFNGATYRRFACADITYADPTGNGTPYKRPRIALFQCR